MVGRRIILGLLFVATGVNHLINPQYYRTIMPDYLPWHGPLVFLSGVAEFAFGVLAMTGRWRTLARWGLIAVVIGVFPANVHMAVHADRYPAIPAWALWLRLPLQLPFFPWIWWATEND
jgi:uncharacterized membrane protein